MATRRILLAAVLLFAATQVAAQSPFEIIHGDLFRKAQLERARAVKGQGPFLEPQPTPNELQYDVLHYTLDIAINPTTRVVAGTVRMRFVSTVSLLDRVEVDADNALTIAGVRTASGDTLEWTRAPNLVLIDLPAAMTVGDTAEVEIAYAGTPALAAEPGLFFSNASGYPLVYSLSEPWSARAWWPCKDYPDDKATFELFFSVPTPLFAASNGVYLGYTDETRWSAPYRRYRWREDYPMTTYLASVTAASFTRLDDSFVYAPGDTMPITHYVYPSLVSKAQTDLSITAPALAFFSQTFGLYPFIAEKYGVALCPIGGGMEHETLTSYGASLVTGTHYYDWVYVHEMAHQWFGDLITCRNWVNVWLNEGFASYAEALWFEHLQGPTKLRSYMESKDRMASWIGPILRDPANTDPWYYFGNVVYDKAAWALHMLRHVVGDEAFFQILRDYVADPRYRYGAASTDDFRALCEARYGSSLAWFFDEWLTREDRLQYSWSWKSYPLAGAYNLTIVVDQGHAPAYTMPVDFRITQWGGAVVDTTLWVYGTHEELHLTLPDSAIVVQFDPGHWILCDKTQLAPASAELPIAVSLAQNFPNPFNPSTTVEFAIPGPAFVSLRIFDVSGRLVRVLASERLPAGRHARMWDGKDETGKPAASGLYLYRLETETFSKTRKMVLMR